MISQNDIIKALHSNECPECNRSHMVADRVENRELEGIVIKYYVCCTYCCTQWEITKETFEDGVRVCDTRTYKCKEKINENQ